VGQEQTFTAIVTGASQAEIEWTVLEPNGGTVTQEGIYTAPRDIGIYHVLAVATGNGARAQTIAKVTVVIHYDVPPVQLTSVPPDALTGCPAITLN